MFSIKNRKVLITGATGGIGKEIARVMHSNGAIIGISGTKLNNLEKLKDELVQNFGHPENIHIFPVNLSCNDDIQSFINKVTETLENVDVLINNAGITKDNLSIRMSDEEWNSVMQVNLNAPFKLIKGFIKSMMKKRFGRIINISSIVGFTGNPGQANYCSTKSGIVGMSKSLAQEYASRGITVNCIAPGFIESAMTDALSDTQKESLVKSIPMQKIGSPSDIANAALFLSSDETSYITGQTIHINGGMAMY